MHTCRHPCGTAPILEDGPLKLSESSAIMEYIVQKYAPASRLKVPASEPGFPDYVYWYGYVVGSLQGFVSTPMMLRYAGVDTESVANPVAQHIVKRMEKGLVYVDARLKETGAYLAGPELTLADIYAMFTLTTMRLFNPFALTEYPGVYAWVQRIAERPAYKRFIEKAEQGEERGVVPTTMADAPKPMSAF